MGKTPAERTKTFNPERGLIVILTCLVGAFFLFGSGAVSVQAQAIDPASQNYGLTPGEGIGQVALGQTRDLKDTIAQVINIALGFLGVIAVGLIIYAGFLWMTAHGNEDQVGRAKLILRNAVIGLVIIFAAWGIAAFVINQLRGATGNGPGDGSGGPGGGNGGGLPAERFTLQEFQTSHAGATNRDDVFRCGNIQPRFNHWLSTPLDAAARAGIRAVQRKDSANQAMELPLAMDVDARNNVLLLERRNNDNPAARVNWPAFAEIEIQVPKSLSDYDGKPLSDCTALGCNNNGDHYGWLFTTTDKLDTTPPALTSAVPRLQNDAAGYPDRNVNRAVTFTFNFSEPVDVRSLTRPDNRLIPEHVKVEQIVSSTDQTVVAAIPTEHWDASVSETGLRFSLNKTHQSAQKDGPYLEPFAWYRLTVQDVVDLCNNPLRSTDGNVVSWIFQTNGNVPGVAFVYPADQYQFACPSTEAFVQFKTSMYDVKRSSCAVNPDAGGLVLGGSGLSGRNLAVRDDLPSATEGRVIDPNNYCKRYDFGPATAELAPNATYNPKVDYRNPANDSQTEQVNWSFAVKPASGCANAPYISRVSPGEGPWGRCVTVSGNNFGESSARGGGDAHLRLDLSSTRNGALPAGQVWPASGFGFNVANSNWFETYLTGTVPAVTPTSLIPPGTNGLADFQVDATRSVTLGGAPQLLRSNAVSFTVHLDEPPYQGPCLGSLTPALGNRGIKVALSGTNFGVNKEVVTFTDRTLAAAIDNWANSTIRAIVPPAASDGLVHVETAQGVSNGLPFDVAVAAGGACTVAADCAPGLICPDGICVRPSETRPTGFRIEDAWPAAGCTNTCTNAAVGWAANFDMNRSSLQPAVVVLRCQDQNCATTAAAPSEIFTPLWGDDDKRVNLDMALAPTTSYRVIVRGTATGLRSSDGKNLVTLNYDSDNDGGRDAYSWVFTTGRECALSRLQSRPSSFSLYEEESEDIALDGYSRSDTCSPNDGQLLAPASLPVFAWRACAYQNGAMANECRLDCPEPRVGSVPAIIMNSSTSHQNVVTGKAGGSTGTRAWGCAFINEGAIKAGAVATVRARCRQDSDCAAGGQCPNSSCNRTTGRCLPVINDAYPPSGAIGTWVTVRGCYFGNQPGAVSGARSNALFEIPLAFCGQYWTNNSIIAEVPTGLQAAEPLKVTKNQSAGGESATWSQQFTTDQTNHPALCRLEPGYGAAGAEVSLFGKNFGARNESTDKVVFESLEATNIKEWEDSAVKTIIRAVVPAVNRLGDWAVRVVKGIPQSNPVNFNVTAGVGAGPAALPEALLVESYTPGAGARACPAMIVEVVLAGILDNSSLTNNFYVRRLGANAGLLGQAYAYDYGVGKTRLVFAPEGTLALGTNYEIVLRAGQTGLRSQTGGSLVPSALCPAQPLIQNQECVIGFSTIGSRDQAALNQCTASSLSIAPANPLYFCAGDSCAGDVASATGHQRHWFGRLTARNGQPLNAASPFVWATEDRTIIDPFGDNTSTTSTYTILPKNGETTVSVATTIGGKTFSAATAVRVFLCENPWPSYPRAPFRDEAGNGYTTLENWTNFSTFYCRDKGKTGPEEDLPAIPIGSAPDWQFTEIVMSLDNKGQSHSLVPGLIKELFFTVPRLGSQKSDAIGLRVLQNPEHNSINDWYNLQTFTPGSPQAMTVDGYPALRDGRTVYVMAPNDSDGEAATAGSIYTNVYLLSMSDKAEAATQDIFNQLLANWRFAVNISDLNHRDALRRDMTRLADLRYMADIIEPLPAPPSLSSGSFTPNLSVSVWPSWSGALTSDLGKALPRDPSNSIVCAPGYDQATCFNKNLNPQFQCLSGNIYQYKYWPDSGDFTLKANLEYQGLSWAHPSGSRWRTGNAESCLNTYYGR